LKLQFFKFWSLVVIQKLQLQIFRLATSLHSNNYVRRSWNFGYPKLQNSRKCVQSDSVHLTQHDHI